MKNLKNLFLGYLLLVISFGYSQQPHSGGIVVPTGFKITANQPVDDRTVVTSVEDLDNLPNKYAGLICYVENSESVYYYNGTEWNIIGSDIGGYFKEITKDGEFTAEKITGGVNDGKYTFKITGDETLEWTIGDTDYVYNLDSNDEWNYIADALGTGIERRIDAVSYGNDGQIHYWKGTETGQASYPNVPETHILKTFVTLTEDGIIIPSPTDLSGYVLKNHFKWGSSVYSVGSGNDVYLIAGSIVGYHNKVVGITNLYPDPELRILGCNINTTLTNKPLWDGVTIHIKFSLVAGKTIRLKNDISGANVPTQAKFLFPDGLDYLPVHNEILTFVLRDTGFFGWKLEFAGSNMSSGGGATGDFIPLSGTEVGKPLTGEIETDTSNGLVGFYSDAEGVGRRIAMTDDGFNKIQIISDDFSTYFEQGGQSNFFSTKNLTTNESSQILNFPQSTTITTTDADGNTAEIVVGDYGTVRFNSVMPDDGTDGYMYYNSSEGLSIRDNNTTNQGILRFNGIIGRYNNVNWQIRKDANDSNHSYLLFPDSGTTGRRIPVSVNGNYANQQGDIELTNLTPDGTNNLIDVDNKLNPVYLPPNIMHLQGEWNATTNTPTLSNGTGVAGYIYEVTTAGTVDFGDGDIEFALGDWVVYGGNGKWYNSPNTGEVVGVKGDNESNYRKGLVNIDIDDVIAPTANEFLVGNSAGTDWEKRGVLPSDLGINGGAIRVPVGNGNSQTWISSRVLSETPGNGQIPLSTPGLDGGRLKANPAIDNDDLVPLGQLEGMLGNYVTLTGNQTVAGVKTFSSSPIVPTATTTTQAVNKGQMDTALNAYVNAGTSNTTGGAFSLDKVVLRNASTGRTTTITKPNTDTADSNITIPGFGGGTKVMPISVNGVSAGPSGDINLTLDINDFIRTTLGGSSTLLNVNFAAANPDITGYEEIEITIQFLERPDTVSYTDFYLTFNSDSNSVYNSTVVDNSGTTTSFTNQSGFRFKFNSDNGFYTFKVKNYGQTGIPRIITGSGVEFDNESSTPIPWVIGGGFHSDAHITTLQIKSVDGTTNVPYMRVTVKKTF